MEDASSKMLIVPGDGNKNAEEAAQKLGVPVASFSIPSGGFSTSRILHAPVHACVCSCQHLLSCRTNPVFPGPPLAPPTQDVIHHPISQCTFKRQASAMGSCVVSRWAHQSRTRPRGPPWRTRRGRTTPRCSCTPAAPPAAPRACHSATVSLKMKRYCKTVLCNIV